ncbi:MAG TPA: ATP-binding protein [Syntrophorhabdaceae bacterium]|nr:ATP-binding protein [Syntrophorhabdaceae bacterium]
MAKKNEVIPSARRLIKSLRDMGYDFSSAIADLVDNSIEASASLVSIDIEFDGDDSWVRIADNGKGMTPVELKEAMRYGSDRNYEEEDLGKFGLGLKTASLSQCQRLIVASRTNTERADITAYCWDLEHISKSDRWEIIALKKKGLSPTIRRPLKKTRGTVILWQRLDRILGYKQPYGEMARKRLLTMCREVEEHLGMVFHRFLSGEVSKRKLKIMLNGNTIEPWDPFARQEKKTKALQPVVITLEHEGVVGEVKLDPYVLPHQNDFSSPDAFKRSSGPANWNQQQGFYIYRADRLIQSGGWCRLRTLDEHTKLARIALSFSPMLDEAFKINVAKMRVQLPLQIREQAEHETKTVVKIAREVYNRPSSRPVLTCSNRPITEQTTPASSSVISGQVLQTKSKSSTVPEQKDCGFLGAQRVWTIEELYSRLIDLANDEEKPIVSRIFNRFRQCLKKKGEIE